MHGSSRGVRSPVPHATVRRLRQTPAQGRGLQGDGGADVIESAACAGPDGEGIMNPLCAKAKNDKTGLGSACVRPVCALMLVLLPARAWLCWRMLAPLCVLALLPRLLSSLCMYAHVCMHAPNALLRRSSLHMPRVLETNAGADPEGEEGMQEDEGEDGTKRKRGGAKKWTSEKQRRRAMGDDLEKKNLKGWEQAPDDSGLVSLVRVSCACALCVWSLLCVCALAGACACHRLDFCACGRACGLACACASGCAGDVAGCTERPSALAAWCGCL